MRLPSPIRLAMRFALLYSAIFFAGSMLTGGIHARYYGRPFWVVILLYLVGGLFVGCCVDLLRGTLRARWQAGVAGAFIAAPLVFGLYLIFLPQLSLKLMYIATVVSALIYGAGYGIIFWEPPDEPARGAHSS